MAHRRPGRVEIAGLKTGTSLDHRQVGQWLQLGSESVVRGDEQRLQGDHGLDLGFHRRVAGDLDEADHLDDAVCGLRHG